MVLQPLAWVPQKLGWSAPCGTLCRLIENAFTM